MNVYILEAATFPKIPAVVGRDTEDTMRSTPTMTAENSSTTSGLCNHIENTASAIGQFIYDTVYIHIYNTYEVLLAVI
jgi:hypothetical protein